MLTFTAKAVSVTARFLSVLFGGVVIDTSVPLQCAIGEDMLAKIATVRAGTSVAAAKKLILEAYPQKTEALAPFFPPALVPLHVVVDSESQVYHMHGWSMILYFLNYVREEGKDLRDQVTAPMLQVPAQLLRACLADGPGVVELMYVKMEKMDSPETCLPRGIPYSVWQTVNRVCDAYAIKKFNDSPPPGESALENICAVIEVVGTHVFPEEPSYGVEMLTRMLFAPNEFAEPRKADLKTLADCALAIFDIATIKSAPASMAWISGVWDFFESINDIVEQFHIPP
jgi:hypothetical protein